MPTLNDLTAAEADLRRYEEALRLIISMDRRTSGTTSEDHMEFDGPIGAVARKALDGTQQTGTTKCK